MNDILSIILVHTLNKLTKVPRAIFVFSELLSDVLTKHKEITKMETNSVNTISCSSCTNSTKEVQEVLTFVY